jgi:serine/threonine protein kinase
MNAKLYAHGGHATIYFKDENTFEKRYSGICILFGICDALISFSFSHQTILRYNTATFSNGVLSLSMKRYSCDLFEYVFSHKKNGTQISGKTAAVILRDVATAISILHSGGVVHCDIKPENVLLDDDDGTRAVLSDFGTAFLRGGSVSKRDDEMRRADVVALGKIVSFLGSVVVDGDSAYHKMASRMVAMCRNETTTAQEIAALAVTIAGPPPKLPYQSNSWSLRDIAKDDTMLASVVRDLVWRWEDAGKIKPTETEETIADLVGILRCGPRAFRGTTERLMKIATIVCERGWKLRP